MQLNSKPFWLNTPAITGNKSLPKDGGIAIIGSGLSGVSAAYFLREYGFEDITIIDFETENAASFRNCGHVLYGSVESMKALVALHGEETAKEIWDFSIEVCHEVRDTVKRLDLKADYAQDGYLCIAVDETEDKEILDSIELLNAMDFQSDYVEKSKLEKLGFKNTFGGRFEKGSAQAHPVKFRNGILENCLSKGTTYHSDCKVSSVSEVGECVEIVINGTSVKFDAAVIATNAYSPLLSDFFKNHRLLEPFKGQILTSKPLGEELPIPYPHSFDHGYEYALRSTDNRLIIGGWRNNTPSGEIGSYEIISNPDVDQGLMDFVDRHYSLSKKIEWEHSWTGIMATSKTSFPFIGPTNSQLIFSCAGYTGHGFSWAHGCSKLLAKIMAGETIPSVSKHFNPKIV